MTEKKYWFKANSRGFGWYPDGWPGWLVVLGWVMVLALIIYNSYSQNLPTSDLLLTLLPQALVSVALLIAVAWKTGEPVHWKWGK